MAQLAPELLRDLEIIALVPAHVQECLVARERKIIGGGAGANCLGALAVHVGPVRTECEGFRGQAKRIRDSGDCAVRSRERDQQIAGRAARQAFDHRGRFAVGEA